jgi:hypothetical protein
LLNSRRDRGAAIGNRKFGNRKFRDRKIHT